VVTGSYHAAVFALSMGVPAVAVANSAYYVDKFQGLAGQFGDACRVVTASSPDFSDRLTQAIDGAWRDARGAREKLLEEALRQIALGQSAYRRIFHLVERRRALRTRP
jgi:colanic acid/amylovoran biosynthesis protein